ncbi:MAG: hypothetical protein QM648_09920 [Solirubrobacterales bacterium]
MPPRPRTADGSPWNPVSAAGLAAIFVFAAYLLWRMSSDADGYLTIIDDINLVIHEFGHPFFSVFGEWPQWWGGTWMELIVPAVIAGVFWWQRSVLSFTFAAIWFFENFHYIARYIADARAMELPLAGGGEHDWNTLLAHYGQLQNDTQIAHWVNVIGYVGIFASLGFATLVWLQQRGRAEAALS